MAHMCSCICALCYSWATGGKDLHLWGWKIQCITLWKPSEKGDFEESCCQVAFMLGLC